MTSSSPRRAAGIVALLCGIGLLVAVIPSDRPIVWLLRLMSAGFIVCLAPGIATVLAWRPRESVSLLELLGISIGISIAVVQLLTVLAVLYAWSPDVSLGLLGLWIMAHAAAAGLQHRTAFVIRTTVSEAVLLAVLVGLGVVLYAAGSPIDTTEPRIHIAILRRLAQLSAPTLYNMYLAPEIVYTYPFPGIHYLLALMSRLEGIDPLFLYQKSRMLWGIAAPVLLFGCAQAIFGSVRVALAATVVAVGLVANGSFGAVPDFSWAQLAPYTHASDVAMGVLLPALVLFVCRYVSASETRERRFFLTGALALATTLVMVHPREVVQMMVYVTGFGIVAALRRDDRRLAIRAAVVVVATLAVLFVYRDWHEATVATASALVEREREHLGSLLLGASWSELFGHPVPYLRDYLVAFGIFFYGVNPVVLLAAPFALLAFRRHPLTLLISAGALCYLLIVRLPILAIPYLYATYFEMLVTPVRNVILFVHLLAGVCLYVLAVRLSHHTYPRLIARTLAVALAVSAAVLAGGPYLNAHIELLDLFFLPAFALYAGLGWWAWRQGVQSPASDVELEPSPRWRAAFAILLVFLLVATEHPSSSLRHVRWSGLMETPGGAVSALPCVEDGRYCPPPAALLTFVERRIPVESVFAVDIEDEYQSALFMPQQVTAWSGRAEGLIPRAVFLKYYEYFDRAQEIHGVQPFFNDRETRPERVAFLAQMTVTHVLVTPRVHAMMTAVLARDRDIFARVYDDGRWAVYEVAPAYRGVRL